MDLELADEIVLVTSAGQGLGRAIGLAFAAAKEARALAVKSLAVSADGSYAML